MVKKKKKTTKYHTAQHEPHLKSEVKPDILEG